MGLNKSLLDSGDFISRMRKLAIIAVFLTNSI